MTDIIADTEIQRDYAIFYLRLHGWTPTRSDDLKEIWASPRDNRVLIPKQRLDDYSAIMAEMIARIASDEGRAEEDILVDLSWPAYDKLVARTRIDSMSTAIPLQDALGLNVALRDLIVAAARSAEHPQSFFRGGWSASVGNYFDRVRMIPSRPGSFALRALLPLNPESPEELLVHTVDTQSIRKVTRTLLSGISAARSAAEERASGASGDVFEQSVEKGVSADLLDALVRLGGTEETANSVELGVSWTYAAPEQPVSPLRIPAGLIPVLAQGADILRGSPEEAEATVTGLVIRLHRETKLGPGEITVQGYLESSLGSSIRNVKMELDEVTYGLAIAAHRDGATVRARCTIRYGASRIVVIRVDSFNVTAE
jgi:hypothetical protein